jgi:hypothetical protein
LCLRNRILHTDLLTIEHFLQRGNRHGTDFARAWGYSIVQLGIEALACGNVVYGLGVAERDSLTIRLIRIRVVVDSHKKPLAFLLNCMYDLK